MPPSLTAEDYTNLFTAAKSGDTATFSGLLVRGANPYTCDEYGNTAIHWAAALDKPDIIKALPPEATTTLSFNLEGHTPLCVAVIRKSDKAVEALLARGEPAKDVTGLDGYDILHRAVKAQDVGIVKMLVEAGATVDKRDPKGNTAMHLAASYGNAKIIKALPPEANLSVLNHKGLTPLSIAVIKKHPEAVEALLERGALPDRAAGSFRVPILHHAVKSSYFDIAKMLLKAGATPDIRDSAGSTALHWTCVGKTSSNGFRTVGGSHFDMARSLLIAGADANAQDEGENTPLHDTLKTQASSDFNKTEESVKSGNAITILLIQFGADIHLENAEGHTPLYFIRPDQRKKIEDFSRRAKADYKLIKTAGREVLGLQKPEVLDSWSSEDLAGIASKITDSQTYVAALDLLPHTERILASRKRNAEPSAGSGQADAGAAADASFFDRAKKSRTGAAGPVLP